MAKARKTRSMRRYPYQGLPYRSEALSLIDDLLSLDLGDPSAVQTYLERYQFVSSSNNPMAMHPTARHLDMARMLITEAVQGVRCGTYGAIRWPRLEEAYLAVVGYYKPTERLRVALLDLLRFLRDQRRQSDHLEVKKWLKAFDPKFAKLSNDLVTEMLRRMHTPAPGEKKVNIHYVAAAFSLGVGWLGDVPTKKNEKLNRRAIADKFQKAEKVVAASLPRPHAKLYVKDNIARDRINLPADRRLDWIRSVARLLEKRNCLLARNETAIETSTIEAIDKGLMVLRQLRQTITIPTMETECSVLRRCLDELDENEIMTLAKEGLTLDRLRALMDAVPSGVS